MIQITTISGATGHCPVEGCDCFNGTLQVYFDAPNDTPHPSLDEYFLPSLKAQLAKDGFEHLDELELHPDSMQGVDYVSINMGTSFAEQWESRGF